MAEKDLSKRIQGWNERTVLPKEIAGWAKEVLLSNQSEIEEVELNTKEQKGIDDLIDIRKKIRSDISIKERELDDITLNTPNSYKLQVSVPTNLNYLMKAWAAAEGRDLSGIALQCLEIGLREMKSNGGIPKAAIKRYDSACEKMIALAEIKNVWENYESKQVKNI